MLGHNGTQVARYAALRPGCVRVPSRSASISAFRIRTISASVILTNGGRTTARGSLPSNTSASFMRHTDEGTGVERRRHRINPVVQPAGFREIVDLHGAIEPNLTDDATIAPV